MKKLYDIRINPKQPTSEEIGEYMDFDALLKQFEEEEKRPKVVQMQRRISVKRWTLVAASFLAFVFVTFAVQQVFFKSSVDIASNQPFINPPIKTVVNDFQTIEVVSQEGGTFTLADGTTLFIPQNAFTDANGEIISGAISLQYRKYQDIADIFLSGIPMQYDSANVQYNMASVGMMELYGTYNGKAVNIHPDKNLSVRLITQADLSQIKNYNVYQLDTTTKNWQYIALDDVTIPVDEMTSKRIDAALAESEIVKNITLTNIQLSNLENDKAKEIQQIEQNSALQKPVKPTKPATPNSNNFVLDFDLTGLMQDEDFKKGGKFYDSSMYDANEHLMSYQDVMWEVSANQKRNYDIATSNIVWQKVTLEKSNNQQFKLNLSNGSRNITLVIQPILKGEELTKAQATYRANLAAYEDALIAYNALIGPELKAIEKKYIDKTKALELQLTKLQYTYNKARIEVMRSMTLELKEQTIVNQFKVNSFGIWNCDKPEAAAKRTVKARFQDKNGQAINYYMVYVADKNSGSVQRFYTNQKTKIIFNPNAENVLWMVSKDGKVAVATTDEFNKVGNKRRFTFTLNKITEKINTKADVKRILGL